jgi:hypothetical protein
MRVYVVRGVSARERGAVCGRVRAGAGGRGRARSERAEGTGERGRGDSSKPGQCV